MVYLIHFDTKYKHCQHYIGFSKERNFSARIDYHLSNQGSRLIRAVNIAGIPWKVVRMWPKQDGNFERSLKKRKNASMLCPICLKVYENLSSDQKSWITTMLSGVHIPVFNCTGGKTISQLKHLVKFNLAYKSGIRFHIPPSEAERIKSLLKNYL